MIDSTTKKITIERVDNGFIVKDVTNMTSHIAKTWDDVTELTYEFNQMCHISSDTLETIQADDEAVAEHQKRTDTTRTREAGGVVWRNRNRSRPVMAKR